MENCSYKTFFKLMKRIQEQEKTHREAVSEIYKNSDFLDELMKKVIQERHDLEREKIPFIDL